MGFKVFYTKSAFKDVQRLDSVAKKKMKAKIEAFSQKPFFYAQKLISPALGEYRWRIGNHRVIFEMRGKEIIILRIGHRREVYKRS